MYYSITIWNSTWLSDLHSGQHKWVWRSHTYITKYCLLNISYLHFILKCHPVFFFVVFCFVNLHMKLFLSLFFRDSGRRGEKEGGKEGRKERYPCEEDTLTGYLPHVPWMGAGKRKEPKTEVHTGFLKSNLRSFGWKADTLTTENTGQDHPIFLTGYQHYFILLKK